MDQAPGFKKLFNNKNNKSNDIYEELGEAKNANSLAICDKKNARIRKRNKEIGTFWQFCRY